MPTLNSILENKVLGREYKRVHQEGIQEGVQRGIQQGIQEGELSLLRRQIQARFGSLPEWAEGRLRNRPVAEIEELGVHLLKAETLEELLK